LVAVAVLALQTAAMLFTPVGAEVDLNAEVGDRATRVRGAVCL